MHTDCPNCTEPLKSHHCTSPTCSWSVCYNCNAVYDPKRRFYIRAKKI